MTVLLRFAILISLYVASPALADTTQSETAQPETNQTDAAQPDSANLSTKSPAKIEIPAGVVEAPFGLYWGMTKEELEAAGVKLVADEDTSLGAIYYATNLPKAVSDIESVRLFLGFGGKLYKVIAASRLFENDPYGVEVRGRYGELIQVLKDKYGAGKEHKFTAEHYDGNNWGMGIKTSENWLYTNFETKDLSIQISCRAQVSSDPFLVLVYEYKPGGVLEEQAQKEHEKGAL